jgi:adenylate cyclase
VFTLDAYDDFLRLVREVVPASAGALPANRDAVLATGHVGPLIHAIREAFERRPDLDARLLARLREPGRPGVSSERRRVLTTLVETYQDPSSRYLNFYGPPGTIPIVPYHRALPPSGAATSPEFAGKAVFIGLADSGQAPQKDGFYTVFSQPDGVDLSGVEIAATAFGNLLTADPVRALAPGTNLAIILAWGFVTGALVRALPPAYAVPVLLGLGAAYFLGARSQFESAARWWPLVTPLGFQLPAAVLAALGLGYLETRRERANIRRALGYYLPGDVADRVAMDVGHLEAGSSLLHGTCLSTDAHQYTALAETLGPAELGAVMNRYYAAIFAPVKRHGGIVQDVVGDSMLAVWATAKDDAMLRRRACAAALDIARAADRFNQESTTTPLPTRIGLHSGQMLLGNVGAMDHYEYRATGDIVNTATRLEWS